MNTRIGMVPYGHRRFLVVLAGETPRHSPTVLGWVEEVMGGWQAHDNQGESVGVFSGPQAAAQALDPDLTERP